MPTLQHAHPGNRKRGHMAGSMAGSALSSLARFLPGDKNWCPAGIRRTVQQPNSPARLLAPSTPCATKRAASSSEYGAAQGRVRVQALVPLQAGRMGSYQQMLRRPPPSQEPLTPATEHFGTCVSNPTPKTLVWDPTPRFSILGATAHP